MYQRAIVVAGVVSLTLATLMSQAQSTETDSTQPAENEEQLENITVVASRTERDPNQVPSTVSVLSEQEIARELSTDIADLVRYEPGISVGGTGSRWGLQGFTIRGIGGNRVLVVMDGVRVPDQFSFGPFLNARRDVVDIDSLSKVEIMRGPVSVLHGSDALGGVVAYTSKRVSDRMRDGKSWFAEGKYRFDGSSNDSTIGFALGFQTERVAGGVFIDSERGNETQTAGNLDVNGPQREVPDPSDISSDNIVAKLSVFVNPMHTVKLTLEDFSHKVDTQILSDYGSSFFGTTIHSRDGIDTKDRQRVVLNYEGQFDNTVVDRMSLIVYSQSSTTEQLTREQRESFGLRLNRTRRSVFEQEVNGMLFQIDKQLNHQRMLHHVIFGWDYQSIDSEEIRWGATFMLDGTPRREFFPYPTRDFPLSQTSHAAAFLQDELTLLDGRLLVSTGIRHHQYEVEAVADAIYRSGNPGQPEPSDLGDSKTTGKIGSIFNIDNEFSVYASFAQGFRAPPYNSVNVGFTNPIGGYKTISNPNLLSETSNGYELGLRYVNSTMNGRIVAFWTDFENFIEDLAVAPQFGSTFGIDPSDGLLTFQSINHSQVEVSGWELSGDVNLALIQGIQTRARVAFGTAKGEDKELEQPINSIDPAKLVVGFSAYGSNWNGSAVLTHVADKKSGDIAEGTFQPVDGHSVLDILGEWQVRENIKVNAGVFNLFSEEYIRWADAATIGSDAPMRFAQPGRHLLLSIRIQQ